MMNVTIGFASTLGEGSFYYFDVPISDKAPLPIQVEEKSDTSESSLTKRDNKKILYIDDTPNWDSGAPPHILPASFQSA